MATLPQPFARGVAHINYVTTTFPFKTLTKVHSLPTYELLRDIKNELKANAASVQCDLGGGDYGHLGLVLTDDEYKNVTTTAYIRPKHPGDQTITATTIFDKQLQVDNYIEKLRLFREANAVEQALLNQLAEVLPAIYMKSYRNQYSHRIDKPIRELLGLLLKTYGSIGDEELDNKATNLKERIFEIEEPMVSLYNAVEDLQQLATASLSPYTDKQMVSFGIRLIKNMGGLQDARKKWLTKDTKDQTWKDLKTHFDKAWTDLRLLHGPTMKDASFTQQMNLIQSLNNERKQLQESQDAILHALSVMNTDQSSDPSSDPSFDQENANNLGNNVQSEVLKLLMKLNNKIQTPTKLDKKRKRLQEYTYKYKEGKWGRNDITKYCHTHGACAHQSDKCPNKRDNHKSGATFANKLDGSTRFCQFVQS